MDVQLFGKNQGNFIYKFIEYFNFRIDCIWTGELPLKVSNVFQEYNHSCYINEDNVALFSLLKDRDNNKYFLICNTHLLYNSSKNDIKFCQIMIIYKAFSTILQNFGKNNSNFNFICFLFINFRTFKTISIFYRRFKFNSFFKFLYIDYNRTNEFRK